MRDLGSIREYIEQGGMIGNNVQYSSRAPMFVFIETSYVSCAVQTSLGTSVESIVIISLRVLNLKLTWKRQVDSVLQG